MPSRDWKFDLVLKNHGVAEPLDFALVKPDALEQKTETLVIGADDKLAALKKKRAMEMAMVPGKNLLMTAVMMYMSGQGVHIFSVGCFVFPLRVFIHIAPRIEKCAGFCYFYVPRVRINVPCC